jgi:SulP family sulfate permease
MKASTPLPRFLDLLPGWRLLSNYERSFWRHDLIAGLVVALVLIPSAVAYADLAKCSPIAGLYAALGGMVAFTFFTTSRHVVVGPDAAVSILVGAAVGPLADGEPGRVVVLATWLGLIVAAILLAAGWLKLGGIAELLSTPVMLGYLNGAALVIVISQIGKLFGIPLDQDNSLLRALEWVSRLSETNWPTLLVGLGGIGSLVALRWWLPRLPGTIVIFSIALLAGHWIDLVGMNIAVFGKVDTHMPNPVPPELSLAEISKLVMSGLGLALLIFPEGILLGRTMATRHKYEVSPNRELIALGIANLAASLLRGFPVGASQSRTLLNSATGGCSQMVSLIAAVILIGFLYFLAPWIATLPTVAIASILVYTGISLVDIAGLRRLCRQHPLSAALASLTSIGVLVIGVLPGIMVGVVLSLLKVLTQIIRPHDALLGRVPGQQSLHDIGDDDAAQTIPGLLVYRFYGPLVFANVRFFIERVEHFLAQQPVPVKQFIIDARAIPEIDVTAAELLRAFFERLRERGIRVVLAKAQLPLREAVLGLGMGSVLSEDNYFPRLADAVAAFEKASKA